MVDFGICPISILQKKVITIKNYGAYPLKLTINPPISLTINPLNAKIGDNESVDFTVMWCPKVTGRLRTSIKV